MKPVNAGVIWDMDGVIVDTGEYHSQGNLIPPGGEGARQPAARC
jgi:hypothetical protein